jgi:hypothetical protein
LDVLRVVRAALTGLCLVACAVVTPAATPPRPPKPELLAPLISLFRRELAPPPAPRIAPLRNQGLFATRAVRLEWAPEGQPDAIAGYGYVVGREPDAALPERPVTAEPAAVVEVPEDGAWYFRVRALDNWGNWSEPATTQFAVDSIPLQLQNVKHRTFSTNPSYASATLTFTLTKPADVTVDILAPRGDEPLRHYELGPSEGDAKIEWDARDESGALVPAGAYRYRVTAADGVGNRAEVLQSGLAVTYKRVVISLAQQTLWAYDGDTLVLRTLITSGGPQTPTPPGTFEVMTRQSPFTFKSPWPKGHPFWYPDSVASFAMLFDDGGYFLHDAPWRGNFGPGSNTYAGTPGGDYTGTHGCVNIPYGAAALLFRWAELGTPVDIS